ncbi:hypothetical protein GS16_02695 [Candidatus Liberibacter solanacearum]|nr:hypothetical protein GS16_02695 [Candidatus Liberibacter solanacearum]
MRNEIEILYQTKWTNLIESLAPYNKSQCAEAVTIKTGLVGEGVVFVKQCGEMEAVDSRYAATVNNLLERRLSKVSLKSFIFG